MLAFKTQATAHDAGNLRKLKSIIRIRLSARVIPTPNIYYIKSDIAKSAHTKIINFLSPALSAAIIKGNNNKTFSFPSLAKRFDVREYIQKAASWDNVNENVRTKGLRENV